MIAGLLLFEALSSASWLTQRLSTLAIYGWVTLLVLAGRAAITVLQGTAAVMLLQRHPAARTFAHAAILAAAVALTVELGFHLAPTSVFPTLRWPYVAAYWLYSLALRQLLVRRTTIGDD